MPYPTDSRTETARPDLPAVVADHFDGWDVAAEGAVHPCTGWSCVTRAEDPM